MTHFFTFWALERNHEWKYFINQAGTAIPLMSIHDIEIKLDTLYHDSIKSMIPQRELRHRFTYKHVLR